MLYRQKQQMVERHVVSTDIQGSPTISSGTTTVQDVPKHRRGNLGNGSFPIADPVNACGRRAHVHLVHSPSICTRYPRMLSPVKELRMWRMMVGTMSDTPYLSTSTSSCKRESLVVGSCPVVRYAKRALNVSCDSSTLMTCRRNEGSKAGVDVPCVPHTSRCTPKDLPLRTQNAAYSPRRKRRIRMQLTFSDPLQPSGPGLAT